MGNLRVIGGERKGFPLVSPAGLSLRPTSGRVREALFDILGSDITGARFLDLYAGTGAVGIEALSRGAQHCFFMDAGRPAVSAILRNLESCGLGPRGRVLPGSLPASLARLPRGEHFDLVFVDPPYGERESERILAVLGTSDLLAPRSRVILEHRKSWTPPGVAGRLALKRSVRYGDTVLSFYTVDSEGAAGRRIGV